MGGVSTTVHLFEQNHMLQLLFGAEPEIAGRCIVSMLLSYPYSFISAYLGQEF